MAAETLRARWKRIYWDQRQLQELIMIQRTELWEQFAALPPAAQRQVEAFIEFLRSRTSAPPERKAASSIADDPFIGLWRDREDLADASAWVRRLRTQEWGG